MALILNQTLEVFKARTELIKIICDYLENFALYVA